MDFTDSNPHSVQEPNNFINQPKSSKSSLDDKVHQLKILCPQTQIRNYNPKVELFNKSMFSLFLEPINDISDIDISFIPQLTKTDLCCIDNENPLYFFGQLKNSWRFFSNLTFSPIVIHGRFFYSTEHYFQSMKYFSPKCSQSMDFHYSICSAKLPAKAKSLVKSSTLKIHPEWNNYKIKIMLIAQLAKFSQDKRAYLLFKTGNRKLVESSPFDSFWGEGRDKMGENQMGKCLMQVRKYLWDQKLKSPVIPTYSPSFFVTYPITHLNTDEIHEKETLDSHSDQENPTLSCEISSKVVS